MLNKEDKKDVKTHMGKAMANKVSRATNDSINRIKKQGSKYSEKHSMFTKKGYEHNKGTIAKNKGTNITAKDSVTKHRALRGITEKNEAYASGNKKMYDANRSGYRKTHRERQKSGEAGRGSKSYIPYRREN